MVHALDKTVPPVLTPVSLKSVFRGHIYPSYGIHYIFYRCEVHSDIVIDIDPEPVLYRFHRLSHAVYSRMGQLVQRPVGMECHVSVSRYRCQQYLLIDRIHRHDHVDVTPGNPADAAKSIYPAYVNIERLVGDAHPPGDIIASYFHGNGVDHSGVIFKISDILANHIVVIAAEENQLIVLLALIVYQHRLQIHVPADFFIADIRFICQHVLSLFISRR